MEQFNLCILVEREPELDQAARRFREVDGHDQAAIRPLGRLAHDENRARALSEHAFHRLAHEERPNPSDRRGAPDHEVGASGFREDVLEGESDSAH